VILIRYDVTAEEDGDADCFLVFFYSTCLLLTALTAETITDVSLSISEASASDISRCLPSLHTSRFPSLHLFVHPLMNMDII